MGRHRQSSRSRVGALLAAALCAALLNGCAFLSRASDPQSGVQADSEAYAPALSADGRWAVFDSYATNLVPGDTNDLPDVFVRDNWTNTITRVDVSDAGAESNGELELFDTRPAISDDGRIVAFVSYAANLSSQDTHGLGNAYWHDRDTDHDGIFDEPGAIATRIVSSDPNGVPGDHNTLRVSMNASGSVVAFDSYSTNLLAAPDVDTNGVGDVFAATFDLASGQRTGLRIVSRAPGNPTMQGNQYSGYVSTDASGAVIAFTTFASNLLPNDSNGVYDMVVNNGTQLLRGTGPVEANAANGGGLISRDGSHVVYESEATNLVAGDTVANLEVFVTEYAVTGFTVSASRGYSGSQGFGPRGGSLSIGADGARVAFASDEPDLVPGDTNDRVDLFVHDVISGITQRVNVDVGLGQGSDDPNGNQTDSVSLSADGRFVVFTSGSELLRPDTNGQTYDVFTRVAMVPVVDSVNAIDPVTHAEVAAVLHPGANEIVIHGAAFGPGVSVGLGAGTTASVVTVATAGVRVNVQVAPNAAPGTRDVVVGNLGTQGSIGAGTIQRCHACATVAAN